MRENVDYYFLYGCNKKGKTLTLRLLYYLFMKHGGEYIVSAGTKCRGTRDWKEIYKECEHMDFSKTNYIQNIDFKIKYKDKIIFIFSWGDSFEGQIDSIRNAIESLDDDVDIFVGACHPIDVRQQRIKKLVGKDVDYTEQVGCELPSGFFAYNIKQAELLFNKICTKITDSTGR